MPLTQKGAEFVILERHNYALSTPNRLWAKLRTFCNDELLLNRIFVKFCVDVLAGGHKTSKIIIIIMTVITYWDLHLTAGLAAQGILRGFENVRKCPENIWYTHMTY